MFPDAEVSYEVNRSNRVVISACPPGAEEVQVADVAQRDLYRKYSWPAKPILIELLQKYKKAAQ